MLVLYHRSRCIGFARRRVGRGGRVILDRIPTNFDKLWTQLKHNDTDISERIPTETSSFILQGSNGTKNDFNSISCEQLLKEINTNYSHFRPATPEPFIEEASDNDIFESDMELFGFTSNLDYCSSFEMEFCNEKSLNQNHESWEKWSC